MGKTLEFYPFLMKSCLLLVLTMIWFMSSSEWSAFLLDYDRYETHI